MTTERRPDRKSARSAVAYAIHIGRLPPASAATCIDCGNVAAEYDHHLGYGREHRLDVQPVCRACHNRRTDGAKPDPVFPSASSDMTNRDDLIAVMNVRQEYGADRSTVVRWIAAGKLEPVKVPRDQRTYVRRAQLEAVLREEPARRGRLGNWRKNDGATPTPSPAPAP